MRTFLLFVAFCLYVVAVMVGESIIITNDKIGAVSVSTMAELERLLGESPLMSAQEAKNLAVQVKLAIEAVGEDVNVYWQVNPILSLLACVFVLASALTRKK